ncbi:MAG: tetratricopeptide repeat protein [Nannocystaceae bacterium]|nr:tetratricopeptide repeat protein [Nannocystaceae bacterium]
MLGETAPRLRAHLESSRGTALQRSGRYLEAGAALRRSAELFATLQTGPSVAVANALINQTIVLNHLGERERALETLERAAATIETLLGQEHPRYGVVEINLGNLLLISQKDQDARLAYERGLKIYRNVYGVDSIRTARALIGLISAETQLNNLDAARERGLEALAVLDSQTERPRTLVGAVQNLLGRTERLKAQRTRDEGARLTHLERAQQHYTLALEEFRVVFGGRPDERILKTNAELCSSLRMAGKRELARRRCLVALEARSALGEQPMRSGDALTLVEFGLLADDAVEKELLLWSGLQLYATLEAGADTIDGHFALAELWWARPRARPRARALIVGLRENERHGWERQRVATWLRTHRSW